MPDPSPSGALRLKIAAVMERALDTALDSYEAFLAQEVDPEPKAFGAHHTACKAAIIHIELLLKMIRSIEAETPQTTQSNHTDIETLLSKAKAELAQHARNKEGTEDE